MAYLEEHETIDTLLNFDNSKLKSISKQRIVSKVQDDELLVQFDIVYNNHEGHITIRYNFDKNTYGNITLDIDFARPAGAYNYPNLYKLAPKFMQILTI